MRSIQHESNNDVLSAPSEHAPQNTAIGACRPLAITRAVFTDGVNACVSFWSLSADELELLAAGCPVRLCALVTVHAPISVGADGSWLAL